MRAVENPTHLVSRFFFAAETVGTGFAEPKAVEQENEWRTPTRGRSTAGEHVRPRRAHVHRHHIHVCDKAHNHIRFASKTKHYTRRQGCAGRGPPRPTRVWQALQHSEVLLEGTHVKERGVQHAHDARLI